MSNTAIVPFNAAKMAAALKRTSRESSAGSLYLRMEKTGEWIFGAAGTEIGDDEKFLVNPGGFQHGYVAWGDGAKLGEIIAPVDEALPETGPVPGGCEKGWELQLGLTLVSVDAGTVLVYRSTSVGGRRAIAELAGLVGDKLIEGDAKCVPVVTLSSESYKHKTYGKIYNPVLTIGHWVVMPEAGTSPKAAAAAPKSVPAKKALAAPAAPPAPVVEVPAKKAAKARK